MFNEQQLKTMLEMQSAMNAKVNPDWLNAGNNWMLAAALETAEAIDHHGWKWWKKQTPDMPQLRMEMVDIWHFILSYYVDLFDGDITFASEALTASPVINSSPTLEKLQTMLSGYSAEQPDVSLFYRVLGDLDMGANDLYQQYVGKNVLNFFRQDNGYKEGTYVKIWDGREDNEHLTEILESLDPTDPELDTKLINELNVRYRELTQ